MMHGPINIRNTSVSGDRLLMDLLYFFVTSPIHGYQAKRAQMQ